MGRTDRPVIGVTMDVATLEGRRRYAVSPAYAARIEEAGGAPVMLAPSVGTVAAQVSICDGIVLTGGDDPRMERYGASTHPKATPIDEERQAFEEALLAWLGAHDPEKPVLGVCLGMQMMGLAAGGRLDQHMPETSDPDGRHWDAPHTIVATPGQCLLTDGVVHSRHRQCLTDGGSLTVIARAPDGVIEGICDAGRAHYVGVQWHPERTEDEALGAGLFRRLVSAARRSAIGSP